jgi:hypothetical protein
MKLLKLVFFAVIMLFAFNTTKAQVQVRFNIGEQPQWAPVEYQTDYYYLPDVEAYYDVQNSMFIYYERNSWIHRSYLPSRYKNYDLYSGYKVPIKDYHGLTPYYNHRVYKERYSSGKNRITQKSIGQRPSDYRNYNQVNRNRGMKINKTDRIGDRNYDKHGIQRHQNVKNN